MTLIGGCGGGSREAAPPPAVDLERQAAPASEIVDGALLARHTQGVLAARDPSRYLAQELWRIGLVSGGAKGGWMQPFENRRRVAHASGNWVLARGEVRATLGARHVVAALGGRGSGVRLRGLSVVFVAPTLASPPGNLASKVVVVLDPLVSAQPGSPPPLSDLLRRAAAARAHAVLVLPRPGVSAALPSPMRAAELLSGTGLLVAAWLDETAARELVRAGLDVPLEALARLEWRSDLLPLALGRLHAEVTADVEREPHRNLVAVLPGRAGAEALAVVATLPGTRRRGVATSDPRGEAAAAAELLAVATAFQALSDPPRRTVVFAFTDPGDDGLAGARQLAADARWHPPRLAAALVLAGGNLGPPTQEVTFVGARASPLYGLTTRLAALQGRRVVGASPVGRDVIWQSPAWALLQARVPTVLLEPGVVPRSGPALPPLGTIVPAAAAAPQPFAGLVEDARLAFRIALELAEGGRPPRVDPAKVEAVLRRPEPPPMVVAPVKPRPRRAVAMTEGAGGIGATATEAGGDAAAGQSVGPSAPGLSTVPEFVAPPPEGAAPPPIEAPPPVPPPSRDQSPPQPAPSPTPPHRGR